jgi:Bacterial PH domain
VLQIHYVLPRTRSLSVSRVRGVTIERSVWMTRIELDTGYPIVLPGWVPAVKRLVE